MCIRLGKRGEHHTTGAAETSAIRAVRGSRYFMLLRRVSIYHVLFDEEKKEMRARKLLLVGNCKLNEWTVEAC